MLHKVEREEDGAVRCKWGWIFGILLSAPAGDQRLLASVHLEWRPIYQFAGNLQIVHIGLYAVSGTGGNQPFGFVDAVLQWDPARLEIHSRLDNGPYAWAVSEFPNDSALDGLNFPFTGPAPFVPANDGNAFYQASRRFEPDPPPLATPQGLLVTTFRFRVNMPCGVTSLVLAASGGPNTFTRVLDAQIPGQNITGTIGPPAGVEVRCDDGVFCNGPETCQNAICVPGTPTCFGSTPYCIESLDICAECLNDGQCSDGVFCNGVERCLNHACSPGAEPCPGQFCNEVGDFCFECTVSGDCDDSVDCTLDICSNGQCINFPDSAACDDGVFCNGPEICHPVNGCTSTANPCHDPDSCDEIRDVCGDCPGPMAIAAGPRYFMASPPPGDAPVLIIVSGDPADADIGCAFEYVQANGRLGNQPVLRTPDEWGAIFVTDLEIRPRKKYYVCTSCERGGLSAITEVSTWRYGDVNRSGQVTLDDLLCMLGGFSGLFGEPPGPCSRYALDLIGPGCVPDLVINIDDILAVLNAFAGMSSVPSSCPMVCPAP